MSPSPRGELRSLETATGPIDGLCYDAGGAARGAALLMHGNGGNFYTGPVRWLVPHLLGVPVHCYAFNRRGHETLTTRTRRPEGNAYQSAAQTIEDMETVRAHAAEEGHRGPVVVGHSNGGLYGAHHAAVHPGVRALVLLSAHCGGPEMLVRASSLGLLAQDRREELSAAAQRLVEEGRPEELLLLPGWWYVISAAAYLDLERNVPRLATAAPAITCPVLFVRGSLEDPALYPAEEFAASCAAATDVRIVEGADHFYTGHEEAVGRLVATWLDGVLDGGRHGKDESDAATL